MEQSKSLPALPCTAEVQFVRHRRSVLEKPVTAVQVRLSDNRGRIRGPDQIRVKWREGSYRIGEYCREY